jgi:hypothetical protein
MPSVPRTPTTATTTTSGFPDAASAMSRSRALLGAAFSRADRAADRLALLQEAHRAPEVGMVLAAHVSFG